MDNNDNRHLQELNRQRLRIRISQGIKKALLPPFLGLIPILVLTALLCLGLSNRKLIFDINSLGMLYQFFDYIKIAAMVSVYLAFLLALLALLGKPYKWSTAESAALRVFKLQSSPEECPILISSKCMKNGARRWEFFSMWVPIQEWEIKNNINGICHTLECHLVGQIAHGGKNKNDCHRIVFYTNTGAKPANRGMLTDEEI